MKIFFSLIDKLFYCFFLFFLLLINFNSLAQRPYYQQFTVEDGLASSTIYAILQDQKGFLWMGTEAGVSHFDGIQFENFSKENGLGDNEIFSIYEDQKGRVWFFPFNGHLSYFWNQKIYNEKTDSLLQNTFIQSTFKKPFEDESGNLWLGTQRDGIILIGNKKSFKINLPQKYNNIQVLNANDSSLEIQTNFQKIWLEKDFKSKNPEITFKVKEAINLVKPHQSVLQSIDFQGDMSEITKIFPSQKNVIWHVITKEDDVYQINLQNTHTELLFQEKKVSEIFQDRENNVWFATLGEGLFMQSADEAHYFDENSGLHHHNVQSLEIIEDEIFVGYTNGLLEQINQQEITPIQLTETPYNRILEIKKEDNSLWCITDKGLIGLNYKNQEIIQKPLLGATKCLEMDENYIYVGNYGALYRISKKDKNQVEKIWNQRTISIYKDFKNKIWFGTNEGLYCFENEKVKSFKEKFPLLNNRIRAISGTSEGKLIIGTHGEGILIFDGKKIIEIDHDKGLSSNICHRIYKQNNSIFWLGTNNGLNRIQFQNKNYKKPIIDIYRTNNGLISNYIQDICISNKQVYVATDKGLSYFTLAQKHQDVQPSVYITNFKINDRDTILKENYLLDYDQNKIDISFTGISFKSGKNTKFKYKLEGLKDPWHISKNTSITYQSLPAGNYKFLVSAIASSGIESEKPAEISFKIKLPFWKQWWFILAVLGFIFLIIRWIVRLIIRFNEQKKLAEKNKIIEKERQRAENLLLNILPAETAEELKTTGKAKARSYESVTVFFSDFKGFTSIAEQLSPEELVAELHFCFKAFDEIIGKYKLEKIKTIGDAYMCASGLTSNTSADPKDVIRAAKEIQTFMKKIKLEKEKEEKPYFQARIGINTGPVVSGVVGIKKFAYDIWGDTVNTASRIESSGEVGKINISQNTYELVKDEFNCKYRGKIQAKNKGEIDMYFVED